MVSYYGERASSRHAAQQALMVTTLGGLAMLKGIILLGRQTGTETLEGYSLASKRIVGPSSVMISAPTTSRLRIDSAMTASGIDTYRLDDCDLPVHPERLVCVDS